MGLKMKTVIFLGLLAASCATSDEWFAFKRSWGKMYSSLEEELYRTNVFEKNMLRIKEHNKKFEKGIVSYQMEINSFGDLTDEEFTDRMLNMNVSTSMEGLPVYTSSPLKDDEILPSSVDWRKAGAVTPVKNNGLCGSSYAFSATGSLEGQHFLKTGYLKRFSEQQLVDCSSHFSNYGCRGGMPHRAFWYIIYNKGIALEETYPYTGQAGPCLTEKCVTAAKITGIKELPQGEEVLKAAVAKVGPISIAVAASAQFRFYKKGIFDDATCASLKMNHAMLAVGYGSEGKHDYWLVKNSWGEGWGEKGYIRMSRNKNNQCLISSAALYPLL